MKTPLTLSAATQLMTREFVRQRSPGCPSCSVPGLFWGPAPGGINGIWYLKALPPCPQGCHSLIARIWVDITSLHSIEYSPARPTHKQRPEATATLSDRKSRNVRA